MRLRGISDIETANRYMKEFRADYNKRFAKLPLSTINAHRPLQPHEHLKESLCFKTERTLRLNLTVQHDRILYLIEDTLENRLLKRKK